MSWNIFLRRTWCHPEFLSALPHWFDWICAYFNIPWLAVDLPSTICGFNTHFFFHWESKLGRKLTFLMIQEGQWKSNKLLCKLEDGVLLLALDAITSPLFWRVMKMQVWKIGRWDYCLSLKMSLGAVDTWVNLGNSELPATSLLQEIVWTIPIVACYRKFDQVYSILPIHYHRYSVYVSL